jgi:hypothetical protein
MLFVAGVGNTFPVFFPALLEEFGGSRAVTAMSLTLFWIGGAVLGSLAGLLVDRTSPRALVASGLLATALGFAVAALAPTLGVFTLALGIGGGIGIGLTGMVTQAAVIAAAIPAAAASPRASRSRARWPATRSPGPCTPLSSGSDGVARSASTWPCCWRWSPGCGEPTRAGWRRTRRSRPSRARASAPSSGPCRSGRWPSSPRSARWWAISPRSRPGPGLRPCESDARRRRRPREARVRRPRRSAGATAPRRGRS